ncbi:MAG: NUDIX hydrolase [Clostridia bacterium]|nr:NUDIX hydrolase [Clostridia bacterium]
MVFEEKTLSSELIYDGNILKLRKDKVTVKSGVSYREIVEHNGGSVILPLDSEGYVYMVRQFRKPVERVVLEVPAGKIDKGEDPFETAKRELKEETGITAESIVHLTDILPSVGYSKEVLYIYLATGLSFGETNPDENEALDVEKYKLEDLVKMVMDKKIKDAKSVVAILMAERYLHRG